MIKIGIQLIVVISFDESFHHQIKLPLASPDGLRVGADLCLYLTDDAWEKFGGLPISHLLLRTRIFTIYIGNI